MIAIIIMITIVIVIINYDNDKSDSSLRTQEELKVCWFLFLAAMS